MAGRWIGRTRLHQQGLMEGRDPDTGLAHYVPEPAVRPEVAAKLAESRVTVGDSIRATLGEPQPAGARPRTLSVSPSYQYGQRWHFDPDAEDIETPILRVILCIPLSLLEPNRYGCNVLPDWDRYFARRVAT